jgi:hypothetical protein
MGKFGACILQFGKATVYSGVTITVTGGALLVGWSIKAYSDHLNYEQCIRDSLAHGLEIANGDMSSFNCDKWRR